MDAYCSRPLSIFDQVGDPTLDPTPILSALPPQDRLRPGILTLCVTASMTALLVLGPPLFPPDRPSLLSLASAQHLDLDLSLPEPPPPSGAPVPAAVSTRLGDPAPATSGPRETGAAPFPPSPDSLENLGILPLPDHTVAVAQQPLVPGGGGQGGSGSGGTGGGGGAVRHDAPAVAGAKSGPDHALVPLSAVNMSYSFTAEEKREVFKDVVVRVVIEADGRVATAKAIAGPPRLFAKAEATALLWRFEPLAPHGLKAPLVWTITFRPLGA